MKSRGQKILNFFNKPYPFNDDLRSNAKIITFISLGILLFLIIFQPIEISSLSRKEIFYLISSLVASTFLTLSLNLIILPALFQKIFYVETWTIRREIIWDLWILLTISGSNFLLYSQLLGLVDIHFSDIVSLILVAILPVAVLIVINQDRLLRFHLKSAQELNKKLSENRDPKEKFIRFESTYKKDFLRIKPESLILIKSADNYIEVFYEIDGVVKNSLVRSTLKNAEIATQDFDNIFKCHRTFIINIDYVIEIKGNSQGYKLFFENLDFSASVSQKYIEDFKNMI